MKKSIFACAALLAFSVASLTSCTSSGEEENIAAPQIKTTDGTAATSVVEGEAVTLAPVVENADASTTYLWFDANGQLVATSSTYSFTPTEAGTYTYTLKVINANGTTAEQVFTVQVDELLKTLTFEGGNWASFIDNPQYNGVLLYGTEEQRTNFEPVSYSWKDDETQLTSSLTASWGGTYGYSEGGVAISNYIDTDLQNHATYYYQLAIPESNGSANFAVVYCDAFVSFADGTARLIKSMDVSPTTYQLGVTQNGDGYAASLAESGELYVTVTGYNGDEETGTVTIDMAKDGNLLTTWKTIDLSSLGKVTKLGFTMDGSDRSSYGTKHPKYFAFDNVVVKF